MANAGTPTSSKKLIPNIIIMLVIFGMAALLIRLERPTGTVIGSVFGADGKPLAGASISVDAYPHNFDLKTDAQGHFDSQQIPVGEYYMNARAKGYQGYYNEGRVLVQEGKVTQMGPIQLKELEPNFYMEVWDETKLPDEKVSMTLSGAKVAQVHFTVYQVDLMKYLESGGQFKDLQDRDADIASNPALKQLKDFNEEIPAEDIPEFNHKVKFPVDGKGLFLIHATASSTDRSKVFSHNVLINKTELGFVAKRDEKKILVMASSLLNPQPLAGVSFGLYLDGRKLKDATTNADGTAELSLEGLDIPDDPGPLLVADWQGNQAYLQGPTVYSEEDEGGEAGEGEDAEEGAAAVSNPTIFLYTERPLYRPGQTVLFKGIARSETDEGAYQVLANQTVSVNVTNPKGDSIAEQTVTTNAFGSFWGSANVDEDGDLGYYNIVATLGGEEFTKEFEVQEYRKPEFKVEITADKERYYPKETITFTIDTQFYFGAPMEADVEYTLYQSSYYYTAPGEEPFDDFHYGYEPVGGYGEFMSEGKVHTDANGKATVTVDAPKTEEDLQITLRATAKDQTERTVTKENSAYVVGGDFYFRTQKTQFLGQSGTPYPFTVTTQDYSGKPVARDFKVTVQKEIWDGMASEYRYVNGESVEGKTDAAGRGAVSVNFKEGGYYRLAIKGKDDKGRKVTFYDYVWVNGSKKDEDGFGMEQNLILIADKKKYEAGETAKVFLVGPIKDGKVLVTVEGPRILQYQVVQLDGFSKEIEIPLKKEWMPNVFIDAAAIGKKTYYSNEVEFGISPSEHYLTVDVQSNAPRYEPGQEVTYQVTTKDAAGQGVPAEISLGVVDESLYALKSDSTDIKEFFWGPKENQVTTNWSFSGYYSGGIEKEDQRLLRKNFKDTAFWNPSIVTDASGHGEVKVTLPDNLTTWRATVVAQTVDTQVGQQIQKVIATKNLVTRLAIPRFFTERDRLTLKALVQNYTDKDQTLQATLALKGGLAFANPDDAKTRTITVGSKKTVSFDVDVDAKQAGEATVQLLAKNDQLSDGFELKIPVLPYGTPDSQYKQGELAPASSPVNVEMPIPPQTSTGSAKLKVTVDSSLFAQLLGPLSYLVDYPYGCVEQTTSRMLSALTVQDLYRGLGITDASLDKKIPKVLIKGIKRLVSMQHAEGGWGWWKSDNDDPYMTAYALYGLVLAQQAGQKVDEDVLKRGKEALEKQLKAGLENIPQYSPAQRIENQYFMYYVGALFRLKVKAPVPQGSAIASRLGEAYLILALNQQGRSAEALPMIETLKREMICQDGLCHFSEGGGRNSVGDAEVTAWLLRAFIKTVPDDAGSIESMVKYLMAERRGGFWRQTRETAAVIYALADYAVSLPTTQAGVKFMMTLNDKEIEKINVASPHFVRNMAGLEFKEGKNTFDLLNQADHTLYYQTELTYYSQQDPLMPLSKGVEVTREYVRLKTSRNPATSEMVYTASELKGAIAKGETIGVRLTINSAEPIQYVVMEDPLPAGFEVVDNVRFDKDSAYYTEKEVHDEKIALFMTYMKEGKHVFNYGLRPELPGKVGAMPTRASEMYAPEVRGAGGSTKLEVK